MAHNLVYQDTIQTISEVLLNAKLSEPAAAVQLNFRFSGLKIISGTLTNQI